jgi:hypothetical protein
LTPEPTFAPAPALMPLVPPTEAPRPAWTPEDPPIDAPAPALTPLEPPTDAPAPALTPPEPPTEAPRPALMPPDPPIEAPAPTSIACAGTDMAAIKTPAAKALENFLKVLVMILSWCCYGSLASPEDLASKTTHTIRPWFHITKTVSLRMVFNESSVYFHLYYRFNLFRQDLLDGAGERFLKSRSYKVANLVAGRLSQLRTY